MAVQTPNTIDLFSIGIHKRAFRNLSPSALYKLALEAKDDSAISSTGALISFSGAKRHLVGQSQYPVRRRLAQGQPRSGRALPQ